MTSVTPLSRTCSRPAYSSRMSQRGLGAFMEIVMSTKEEWRPIVGYEGTYLISSLGRIRSLKRSVHLYGGRYKNVGGICLTPATGHNGYAVVCLTGQPRNWRNFRLHRLVAIAFLGDKTDCGMQVHHEDGDKTNNALSNLRWVTPEENIAHATRSGLMLKGSSNASAKLTDGDVLEIRRRRKAGETLKTLSTGFGVSKSSISGICLHKSWTHIPYPAM